jgi:L-threonylcarbamoyladenylate synthase
VNRAIDLARLRTGERPALAAAIAAAGLVCFPTDTVYGIGGVVSPATGRAIAQVKGRRADKPLQVVYPTLELLLDGVALSPAVADAARRLLPGPFTLVVPYPDGMTFPPCGLVTWPAAGAEGGPDHGDEGDPDHGDEGDPDVSGEGGCRESSPGGRAAPAVVRTLGVRVPAWPSAARALARLPFPLLASSANPSGEHDPVSLSDVAPGVRAACDLLLDAGRASGVSSTVLDLSGLQAGRGFRVLRPGAVGIAEIAAILASYEG